VSRWRDSGCSPPKDSAEAAELDELDELDPPAPENADET
jgi:hypothetical protein